VENFSAVESSIMAVKTVILLLSELDTRSFEYFKNNNRYKQWI